MSIHSSSLWQRVSRNRARWKKKQPPARQSAAGGGAKFFSTNQPKITNRRPTSFTLVIPARSAASTVILRGARSLQPCNYGSIGRRASPWPARNCRVQTRGKERNRRNGTRCVSTSCRQEVWWWRRLRLKRILLSLIPMTYDLRSTFLILSPKRLNPRKFN